MKKIIGYREFQTKDRKGHLRMGYDPIYRYYQPIDPNGNLLEISDIPPLTVERRLWKEGLMGKER